MHSPVAKLSPELLLRIFELLCQDGPVSLVPCILCCRQWRLPAESTLYGDVCLTAPRLTRFLDCYNDRPIRSLTVVMDWFRLNPYDQTEPIQTATSRLEALHRLHTRIRSMALVSLSITVDNPWPYTASDKLSAIITRLPDSCTCLEIDVKCSDRIIDPRANPDAQPPAHLCDAIRTILPRLKHLRLRCPQICPALLGMTSKLTGFQPTRALNLTTLLINLSRREPGIVRPPESQAVPCGSALFRDGPMQPDPPSALSLLLPNLQEFARFNSARLKRVQILDVQRRNPKVPNSWAAWIRRDILSQTSAPIPVKNVGGLIIKDVNVWFTRVPSETGDTDDWVLSLDRAEGVAEGRGWFWNQTTSGARLVTAMLREHDRLPVLLTKEQFLEKHRLGNAFWSNEEVTGAKLLPQGPGPLMQVWDLREKAPIGWKRANVEGSNMVQSN